MTNEEKNKVLRALSNNVEYGLMCEITNATNEKITKELTMNDIKDFIDDKIVIKPYLNIKTRKYLNKSDREIFDRIGGTSAGVWFIQLGWDFRKMTELYNKAHFDYYNLIEDDLAIEAPEEMYNTKF